MNVIKVNYKRSNYSKLSTINFNVFKEINKYSVCLKLIKNITLIESHLFMNLLNSIYFISFFCSKLIFYY